MNTKRPKKIVLEIETSNAAFDDGNERNQVQRILLNFMRGMDLSITKCEYPLLDDNGNKCGTVKFK